MAWFDDTVNFTESEDKTKLISYTTGLISQRGEDEVDPDDCFTVGLALQKEMLRWMA